MRKYYGNTWWGKQWLNALADIDYSNRLPRGRTYANKGLARDIRIHNNKITANVQGTQREPYRVSYTVPPFTAREKAAIIELVTANPLHLSRLLNRTLPPELKELCDVRNVKLFPNNWNDLEGECSCPDWAVPCKHMAAVLYLIANEIDKDPFLVFQLHGFNLFKGLEGIGYTTEGQKEISILPTIHLQQPFTSNRLVNDWDESVYEQIDFSRLPELREDLLAILPEKPVFYPTGDFKKIMAMAYTAIAKQIKKELKAEQTAEVEVAKVDVVEDVEVLLDEEMDFLNATLRNSSGKTILSFDEQAELMNWVANIPRTNLSNYSHAVKSLCLVYDFSRKLAEHSAFIPQLLRVGVKHYKVRWIPALLNSVISSIHAGIQSIIATDLLFYRNGKELSEPIDDDRSVALVSLFLNHLVKTNHNLQYRFGEHEIGHLFFNGTVLAFSNYENKEYPNAIQLWLNTFFIVEKSFVPVIQVDDLDGEGFEVNVAVQRKTKKVSAPVSIAEVLTESKFANIRMDVLRDLAVLSEYFPQINDIVATRGEEPAFFDSDDFVKVLFKILPTIKLFGIKVLLPKALRKLMRPRLSMKVEASEESATVSGMSMLNMEEMLKFRWKVALGENTIPIKEFVKMVEQYSGIVKLNDEYVFFEEAEIKALLDKLKDPPELDAKALLQVALTEDYNGAKVELGQKVKKLMNHLLRGKPAEVPKGLLATLRPYQFNGFQWLYKNTKIGFGSVIADDMGLGKTLQVITTLLKLKEDGEFEKQKALAIVPTTLLTNWQKEIERFAPSLISHIYHGPNRDLKPMKDADVMLTTYGVARSETAKLQKQKWLVIVIDEAQNIKNPGTAQTKAIKKIIAPVKIAMSGTPVENRLTEYWSIFDFSNKGYLDNLKTFKQEFAKPIEVDRDLQKLDRFRKITEPFILRRLKSDKSIIKDLPEKIETDQFCELTPAQAALYQNVVDTTLENIEKSTGIQRKGMVLKMITALKQICNHPRQFLKKGNTDPTASGKTQMLFNLMRPILNNGEKTLIFTQYQEMGNLLTEMLEEEFQLRIPFLHGGVSRKGRDEMVDQFQNDRATRVLLLSLKAGGTGLNLTKASNVIHYDLWWNPAVEAQATDRAYRIGQQNNVMVHRFITQGTFEENVNELLQKKKSLANLTVSTGEKWIGEYSDSELRDLVALRE
ncbi:MAG: SNF2-related protein [Saprospiraceae bacterium]